MCKECGCTVCGGKEPEDKLLFCEQCEYVTHMWCLDPPLEKVPEDDFYCPDCKNDANEIVQVSILPKVTNIEYLTYTMFGRIGSRSDGYVFFRYLKKMCVFGSSSGHCCQIFLGTTYQNEEIFGHKICQHFHSKAYQNIHKLEYLVRNYTIRQPYVVFGETYSYFCIKM
jgi:hypothetical protein